MSHKGITHRERIIKQLHGRKQPVTTLILSQELDIHQNTIAAVLRTLVYDGKVTKTREGFIERKQLPRFL